MEYNKHDMYRQAAPSADVGKKKQMPARAVAEPDGKVKEEIVEKIDIIEVKEMKKEVKKEITVEVEMDVPEIIVHKKKVTGVMPVVPVVPVMPEGTEKACGYCVTPGMAYVPPTKWSDPYEPEVGFHRGTIFPELDYPFVGKGACDHE